MDNSVSAAGGRVRWQPSAERIARHVGLVFSAYRSREMWAKFFTFGKHVNSAAGEPMPRQQRGRDHLTDFEPTAL